ncbi:ribosome small subunit-dependent GTPase A [Herbivorax sp. ANBcel31]|uniref:ribosome small subunit-dependent GTPase A n=1 Tax=Herbivorax sp. ANBcel31 TaxID=3069754 RepID=UPI0027B5CD45|nr:ribosome small subunit-dependent GTPase A [Herbivorax sp. ANBcel31]MDQ2087158.1 ribosome small subunit-dependent GTPase A [Herbivorax sp. ANBcel31]
MPKGVIIKGIMGFYYVRTEDGVYECKPRGLFRKNSITPLPGDSVSISVINEKTKVGNIEEIFERTNELVRPSVANINQIAMVFSVKSPLPDFMLLDKLLVTASEKGIEAVIVINKIDLDEMEKYKKIVSCYEDIGYKTIPLNSLNGIGFEKLEKVLKDKITVFAGQSGVGKSTILNKIMNSYIMEIGDLSSKNDRGKHTTRHAELIELKTGGFIVDTPGFSSFQISNIDVENLKKCYPEFVFYSNECKFSGCSHIKEPKCAVKNALESGEIDSGRYNRYVELYKVLMDKHKRRYS